MLTLPSIELDGGIVTASTDPANIGRNRYFVTLIGTDGGRSCVWDGGTYGEAAEVAASLAADQPGIRVVDLLRAKLGGAK